MSIKKVITVKRVAAATAFLATIAFSLAFLNWPNVHTYGQAALTASARRGNTGRMKLLLAIGANADEPECETSRCLTPLVAAAETGHSEAVQLLLDRGANVNRKLKRGQTALIFASYHGHAETVRLLLSNGADVNADCEGDTALRWAKQNGHAEIVDLLTQAGAMR